MILTAIKGTAISRHQCHLMVLVFMVVGYFIKPTVQYRGCGPRLANAVELVCEMRPGINNEDPEDQMDDATQLVSLIADQSRVKKSTPFMSKRTATGFLRPRSRRGIVDECCFHDCNIEELEEYCPPPRGMKAPRDIESDNKPVTSNVDQTPEEEMEEVEEIIPQQEPVIVQETGTKDKQVAEESNDVSNDNVKEIPERSPAGKPALSYPLKDTPSTPIPIGHAKPVENNTYKVQRVRLPPKLKAGSSVRQTPFPHKVLERINRWRH